MPRRTRRDRMPRRDFLKASAAGLGAMGSLPGAAGAQVRTARQGASRAVSGREYNGSYTGEHLNRIAFPMGGIGAGMICLEGTGALSHVSLRNKPEVFNEPCTFAAISIRGQAGAARILEGPVPPWKIFGAPGTGNGASGASFGLPRFASASPLRRCR